MDFITNNLGNIITLITLLSTFILGISDIRRRRAEANKTDSEAHKVDAEVDATIMNEIKRASFDLVAQLKADNIDLRSRLERCEKCLRALGGRCPDEDEEL
jgi:hypothetical protein